jgi:hypothetical protein
LKGARRGALRSGTCGGSVPRWATLALALQIAHARSPAARAEPL